MFKKKSEKKQKDANKLIDYQNKRGGTVLLNNIKLYDIEKDWHNGLGALEVGLELEKSLNQSILEFHALSSTHHDANLTDFIESEFLNQQVELVKDFTDKLVQLKRIDSELGQYLFDKKLSS